MRDREVFDRADLQWLVEIAGAIDPKDVTPPAAAEVVAKARRVMEAARHDEQHQVLFQVHLRAGDPEWSWAS